MVIPTELPRNLPTIYYYLYYWSDQQFSLIEQPYVTLNKLISSGSVAMTYTIAAVYVNTSEKIP